MREKLKSNEPTEEAPVTRSPRRASLQQEDTAPAEPAAEAAQKVLQEADNAKAYKNQDAYLKFLEKDGIKKNARTN